MFSIIKKEQEMIGEYSNEGVSELGQSIQIKEEVISDTEDEACNIKSVSLNLLKNPLKFPSHDSFVIKKEHDEMIGEYSNEGVSEIGQSIQIKEEVISDTEDEACNIKSVSSDSLKNPLKFPSHGSFICGVCRQGFDNITELASHFSQIHIKIESCEISKESFGNDKVLNEPMAESSCKSTNNCEIIDDFSVECKECGMAFSSYDTLEVHSKVHIPVLNEQFSSIEVHYTCDECPLKFEQKSDLDLHKKNHENIDTKPVIDDQTAQITSKASAKNKNVAIVYRCDVCSSVFKNKHCLASHKKRGHRKNKSAESLFTLLKNSLADKRTQVTYSSKNGVKKSDKNTEQFVCNICSGSFRYKAALSLHKSTHHDGIHKFILPKQTKSEPILAPRTRFNRLKKFGGHKITSFEITHGSSRKCENCQASFLHEENLNFHRNLMLCSKQGTKKEESPLKSKKRQKKLTFSRDPQKKTVFACTFCSKVFAYAHNLSYHSRIHQI